MKVNWCQDKKLRSLLRFSGEIKEKKSHKKQVIGLIGRDESAYEIVEKYGSDFCEWNDCGNFVERFGDLFEDFESAIYNRLDFLE